MSHKIAHIPLDFAPTASMCGAPRRQPMNAPIVEATIKASLTDIRTTLEKGLRIAKAAEACAATRPRCARPAAFLVFEERVR